MRKRTKLLRVFALSGAMVTTMLLYSKINHKTLGVPPISSNEAKAEEAPVEYEYIYNPKALDPFFEKLNTLDQHKNKKLNIVHIGDSHIQGDAISSNLSSEMEA